MIRYMNSCAPAKHAVTDVFVGCVKCRSGKKKRESFASKKGLRDKKVCFSCHLSTRVCVCVCVCVNECVHVCMCVWMCVCVNPATEEGEQQKTLTSNLKHIDALTRVTKDPRTRNTIQSPQNLNQSPTNANP